jgi:hypothetical protein
MSADPQVFWDWFVANKDRYRNLDLPEPEYDEVLLTLSNKLHEYHPELQYDIGLPDEDYEDAELVITADGVVEHFPAVATLVDAAPDIEGWEILAFIPPAGFAVAVQYEGIELDPEECLFVGKSTEDEHQLLDLHVVCPNYDESQAELFQQAVHFLLQTCLGEELAATELGELKVGPVPTDPDELKEFVPLSVMDDFLNNLYGVDDGDEDDLSIDDEFVEGDGDAWKEKQPGEEDE